MFGIGPLLVCVLVGQPESDLEIVFNVFVMLAFIREKKGNNLFEKLGLGLHTVDLCLVTLYKVG